MANKNELQTKIDEFFSGEYEITSGFKVPEVSDIPLGKKGKEVELTMLFIDIKESTKIVDCSQRQTAAKMYKSFLWGVTQIARSNNGHLRSFNGDGVLVVFDGKSKNTNAVTAAMQMSWFVNDILKPKLQRRFSSNQELRGLDFNFGIGIDTGDILVIRGGIAGDNNNDLVWVGNATNYAVKFSSQSKTAGFKIIISGRVFTKLNDSVKYIKHNLLNFETRTPIWKNTITLVPSFDIVYGTNYQLPIR